MSAALVEEELGVRQVFDGIYRMTEDTANMPEMIVNWLESNNVVFWNLKINTISILNVSSHITVVKGKNERHSVAEINSASETDEKTMKIIMQIIGQSEPLQKSIGQKGNLGNNKFPHNSTICVCTHTCMRTHAHARTHAHTHTHTQSQM